MVLGVWGLGLRVSGLGWRVQGSGFGGGYVVDAPKDEERVVAAPYIVMQPPGCSRTFQNILEHLFYHTQHSSKSS